MSYYFGNDKVAKNAEPGPESSKNLGEKSIKLSHKSTSMTSNSSSNIQSLHERYPASYLHHHHEEEVCPGCKKSYSSFQREQIGKAAISWGTVLFLTTGICCWIPCVINDCKDHEIVCSNCSYIRQRVPSHIC